VADGGSRGIAWAGVVNLLGGAAGSLTGLLLAAVVGRQLGADGAGAYFVVVAVFMIVSNVAELGADTGLVRFVAAARATDRHADIPRLVSVAARPVLATHGALVLLAAWSVTVWPDLVPGAPGGLVVAGVTLAVLSSLIALALAVSRGLGDVLSYPLLQNITLPLLRLGAVVAVVTAGGGAVAVVTAWMAPVPVVLALAVAVAAVLTTRRAGTLRPTPLGAQGRRRVTHEFWSFSAVRGVSAAVEIALEWIDVLLVAALTSAEQAGIYAVVTRCARAGEVVQQAARIAVGPQISAALARGALDEARQVYGLVTAAMIWLAWPFFIVLAVFPDAVLSIFGPEFGSGALSLTVLSLAMGLATVAGTVQTILLMGGRSSWQLADKSAALVLNVVLNLVLVPIWGIEGAAVAWAATILLDTALVVHQVQHLMGVRPAGRHLWVAAALSLGVTGSVALGSRLVWGSSVTVMLWATAAAAVAHLVVSLPLRRRLGLVQLIGHRSGA
jgi:O-antigen/teichoic acid export membrane protein